MNGSSALFEIHYYDGGLRTKLFPEVPRPEFLPGPAGPKSSELELANGDFAVECHTSTISGKKILWVGCFGYGADRRFGARGNYCGLGIWLIDVAPIFVDRLLRFLNNVAVELSRNLGPTPEILGTISEVAAAFENLRWCVPYNQIPDVMWSERFSAARNTDYRVVPEDLDFSLALIAADILHKFTRKPRSNEEISARSIYLFRRSARVPDSSLVDLDYSTVWASEEEAISDFLEFCAEPASVRQAFEHRQIELENELTHTKSEAQKQLQAQDARYALIETELHQCQAKRDELQAVFDTVSRYIPNIQKANSSLTGGQSKAEVLLNRIHSLVQENVNLSKEIRNKTLHRYQADVLYKKYEDAAQNGTATDTISSSGGRLRSRVSSAADFPANHGHKLLKTIAVGACVLVAVVAAVACWRDIRNGIFPRDVVSTNTDKRSGNIPPNDKKPSTTVKMAPVDQADQLVAKVQETEIPVGVTRQIEVLLFDKGGKPVWLGDVKSVAIGLDESLKGKTAIPRPFHTEKGIGLYVLLNAPGRWRIDVDGTVGDKRAKAAFEVNAATK